MQVIHRETRSMEATYQSNAQLELAATYAHETDRHLFITGRAGTGKTTFLRKLMQDSEKTIVVVAPTGVASMHAGGSTIHRLFQLPFGVIPPGGALRKMRRMRAEKVEILRRMDQLVIDEISMVRPDVLDGIDEVLRHYRQNQTPFGGVQLIMIGDLYQLPPVLTNDERADFEHHYSSRYFFGSIALQRVQHLCVELTHVYRQEQGPFLDILNAVREDRVTDAQFRLLNDRYQPAAMIEEGRVTLCSHRNLARRINETQLGELPGAERVFRATVDRKFPTSNYPTDLDITLKVGAQVMFIKNDTEGRYYNGKIGTVTGFKEEDALILVRCGDDKPIAVEAAVWENVEYGASESGEGLEQNVAGTFTQHPLALAWGITIHKSQGLTFDRVDIDAGRSFDHGQVYVALSRCRTLEGIRLRSPLYRDSIRTDARVREYARNAETPTVAGLTAARAEYQLACLRDLYHFSGLRTEVRTASSVLRSFPGAFRQHTIREWDDLSLLLEDRIIERAAQVRRALGTWSVVGLDDTTQSKRADQVTKAAASLAEMMRRDALVRLLSFKFKSDNRTARQRLQRALAGVRKIFQIKLEVLEQWGSPHSPADYHRVRKGVIQEIDRVFVAKAAKAAVSGSVSNARTGSLREQLEEWRQMASRREVLHPFQILHQTKIDILAKHCPRNIPALLKVPGIGKSFCSRFGNEVIGIIKAYRP